MSVPNIGMMASNLITAGGKITDGRRDGVSFRSIVYRRVDNSAQG